MKELAEKYLANRCSKEDAQKVLMWFQTLEGKAFLEHKLNEDISEFTGQDIPAEDVQSLLNTTPITAGKLPGALDRRKKYLRRGSFVKVAAGILLLIACIGFYAAYQHGAIKKDTQQTEYMTGPHEHQKLTLSDGTQIWLNQNSKLWLNQDPSGRYRAVRLEGEAFFKVIHNPHEPFRVLTAKAIIQDVGTAFNVKSISDERNVQVAVVGGSVLFESKKNPEEHVIQLSKGDFGLLDLKKNQIRVNHFAVKNYLSWLNDRIVFVDASLFKVGQQLAHMYQIKCTYANDALKNLKITADFRPDSLQQVLSVIAQTLHIHYEKNGNKVLWFRK